MTTYERMSRIFQHQEADRIPIIVNPWESTIERWHKEGMPERVHFADFFDLDQACLIRVDNSPKYPQKTLEETEEYKIYTTQWGATLREWKHKGGVPEFLDFTIINPDIWKEARKRIIPNKDRIPWRLLKENYSSWVDNGYWKQALLWFGFDATHSWIVGTERILMALVQDTEWVMDMFSHLLNVNLALLDIMWDAGYTFDSIFWPDDMGYKNNQFFSVDTYREILKPFHKKAIDWAHSKGIKAHLHSCGDVNPFIPELIGMGLNALNPLEVKAGMDPVEIKKKYGDKLVLHGGINAVLWDKPESIMEEMNRVIPILKEDGGYIFSSDHSVPSDVSFEDFRNIINLAKEIGSY